MAQFHFQINDGPEQTIECETEVYHLAAAAAIARMTSDEFNAGPLLIKIWAPSLPDYGPYHFMPMRDESGRPVLRFVIPAKADT